MQDSIFYSYHIPLFCTLQTNDFNFEIISNYDFMKTNVRYVCGMSVPPLMTKSIAEAIKKQWFNQ